MLIRGEWWLAPDGVARPTLLIDVVGSTGLPLQRRFLLDSGADQTVFSAALVADLGLPVTTPTGLTYQGVGGNSPVVVISTALELATDDGRTATVRGQFAGFTDPTATDLSILGRDVLNHFDLIISRRRNEILLLAPNHAYTTSSP